MGPSFPPMSSDISWGGSAKVNRFVSTKPTEPWGRCVFMEAMIPKDPPDGRHAVPSGSLVNEARGVGVGFGDRTVEAYLRWESLEATLRELEAIESKLPG